MDFVTVIMNQMGSGNISRRTLPRPNLVVRLVWIPSLSYRIAFFFIPVSIFRSLTPDVILVFHSILFCSIRDCFSNSSNHFKVNNIIKSVVVIYRTRNKSINNVFNGICSFGIVTSATPNCVLEQRLIAFIANIGNARTI